MIERYSRPAISGLWQDQSKFKIMLEIEILSVEAYVRLGRIPRTAAQRIRKNARFNLKTIQKIEEKTQHDVVAFVTNVSQSVGKDAQYLHVGLTSSDILDTTLGVQLRDATTILIKELEEFSSVLAQKALKYKDMVCIGRTHGIHAEPTTFGLKFALWYDEAQRNICRLQAAQEAVSVGKISGAVGTYANVDPAVEKYICQKLGVRPARIATQVIQRDIYAQYVSTLAIVGASLEKFATEIRHLQRTEVLEAEEPFGKGQKGSSAMPHKRNPVICERICGLARILRSYSLAAMENVALWHERDISHSSVERIILPDATIILDYMLAKAREVALGLLVYPDRMLENLARTHGLIFSQRVLLALMAKGMTRPAAYTIVQRAAMKSWRDGSDFKDNLRQEPVVVRHLSSKELNAIFDLAYYLRHVDTIFRKVGL